MISVDLKFHNITVKVIVGGLRQVGRADGGTNSLALGFSPNSLALGFSPNSFAFGLSFDLVTLIPADAGDCAGVTAAVGAVAEAAAAAAAAADVGMAAGDAIGGVLAGVGVLCSTLSCLAMMEAVGGEFRRLPSAALGGDVPLRWS